MKGLDRLTSMSNTAQRVNDRNRGNAEIIFVALLTVSVGAMGMAGMSVALDVTDQTKSMNDNLKFDLVGTSSLSIEYVDGPNLNQDNTEKLYISGGEDDHVIYNSSEDEGTTIQEGDTVLDPQEAEDVGIENDMTVSVIWVKPNGNEEITDQIYIPDEDITGTTLNTDGNASGINTDTNVSIA